MNFYIHENNNGTAIVKTESGIAVAYFHCVEEAQGACIEWYNANKNECHHANGDFEYCNCCL